MPKKTEKHPRKTSKPTRRAKRKPEKQHHKKPCLLFIMSFLWFTCKFPKEKIVNEGQIEIYILIAKQW